MKRNYGIDLLRIISIYMVVVLHVLLHGGILYNTTIGTANYYISWFLELASLCAVNCFALISGYVGFGRNQKKASIISISAAALFYTVLFTVIGCMMKNDFSRISVLNSLLAFRNGGYWYFTSYFCAWFFFPYLNIVVDTLDRKKSNRLIAILLIMFSVLPTVIYKDLFATIGGYSPIWLMVLYIFGAHVKKYGLEQNKSTVKYLFFYLIAVLAEWIIIMALKPMESTNYEVNLFLNGVFSFTSPPVVLSGVFLFIAMANLKPGNFIKWLIKVISPLAFGVYLVHTQYFVWEFLNERYMWVIGKSPIVAAGYVVIIAAQIFLICAAVEILRKVLFKITFISRLIKKADKKKVIESPENIDEKEKEYVDCR